MEEGDICIVLFAGSVIIQAEEGFLVVNDIQQVYILLYGEFNFFIDDIVKSAALS